MSISCSVVRDLLPLYAEHLASEDSRRLVEKHLDGCPSCREEYRKILTPPPVDGALPLKSMKKHLFRKQAKTALFAAALVFAAMTAAFARFSGPDYVPYSPGAAVCAAEPDGGVRVTFGGGITEYQAERVSGRNGGESVVLFGWDTDLNRMFRRQNAAPFSVLIKPEKGTVESVWYCTPGNFDTLLFGTDSEPSGGVATLPRLALSYYACCALVLLAAGCVLLHLRRKKGKADPILEKVVFVPASYLIGHLCVKGFGTASYSLVRDLGLIVLVGVFAYCALLFGSGLLKKGKENGKKEA